MKQIQSPNLPQDLITSEILTKLPTKALIRFKCVCKDWFFTISSSNFANLHLKHSKKQSLSNLANTLFIFSYGSSKLLKCRDNDVKNDGEIWDFISLKSPKFPNDGKFQIIGSCDGLLCFYYYNLNLFHVWNPCVDEFCEVLSFPETVCCVAGFGYSCRSDDYKIVMLGHFVDQCDSFVFVYSLRNCVWRIVCELDVDVSQLDDEGVLVDGTCYWDLPDRIVGFCFEDDTFQQVLTNEWEEDFGFVRLCVLDGCLCAWGIEVEPSSQELLIDIRLRKKEGGEYCWIKFLKLNVEYFYDVVRFYGFTVSGNVIVQCRRRVVRNEQEHREVEEQLFLGDPRQKHPNYASILQVAGSNITSFVESLVSPLHLQNGRKEEVV